MDSILCPWHRPEISYSVFISKALMYPIYSLRLGSRLPSLGPLPLHPLPHTAAPRVVSFLPSASDPWCIPLTWEFIHWITIVRSPTLRPDCILFPQCWAQHSINKNPSFFPNTANPPPTHIHSSFTMFSPGRSILSHPLLTSAQNDSKSLLASLPSSNLLRDPNPCPLARLLLPNRISRFLLYSSE